jgi:cytochrome c oxidase subunit 2
MKLKLYICLVSMAVLGATLHPMTVVNGQSTPRRIEVVAKKFSFEPAEIVVKKDEPVVLVLKSVDVPHGIRFKDLNIETKAKKGETSEVSFTPSKAGIFVGKCDVFCGAGHGEMKLTMKVEE